jgi:hypothetical protein
MSGSKEFGPSRVPEPVLADAARRAYGHDVQSVSDVWASTFTLRPPTSRAPIPDDVAKRHEEARKAWFAYGDD